ncbi:FG-GAP repeat domain-containing protein [Lysobacter enzymogenes]|uniref:FG-GAP repeat domain-containing protein n=1 Tax=Lysobacter enzymogenes TaxID=69 RepID=UPI001AF0349C|nr:VCBS repeat-containing protein [Lysobacter enzymogenes]QQP99447.1 VCBS repeat-containing protein [Lysobacter enzymogenes]
MRWLSWKLWTGAGSAALVATLIVTAWRQGPAAAQPVEPAAAAPAVQGPVGGAPAFASASPAARAAPWPAAAADSGDAYALTEGPRYRPTIADPALGYMGYQLFGTVLAGDVTGDGRDDLVATTEDGTIQVFVQQPQGGLAFPPQIWAFPNGGRLQQSSAMLVDLNGDGALDIVSQPPSLPQIPPPSALNLLLSDGRGGLALRQVPVPPSGSGETGIGYAMDVDQDGHEDIVGAVHRPGAPADCGRPAGELCRWLRTLYGDGRGGFRESTFVPLGLPLTSVVATLDFDGDGRRDLIYRPHDGMTVGSSRLAWRRQLPQGGLGAEAVLGAFPPWPSMTVALGDFNGDRRLDIATGSRQAGTSTVALRLADGSFAAPQPYPAFVVGSELQVADFDGDGRTDVVSVQHPDSVGEDEDVLAYQLQRNGGLSAPQWNGASHGLTQIRGAGVLAHGDFNGDGCRDVAVGANYEGLMVYYGSGCMQASMSSQDCRIEQSAPLAAAAPAALASPMPAASRPAGRAAALAAPAGRSGHAPARAPWRALARQRER